VKATGDFVIEQNTCTGSLSPGVTCSFSLVFKPTVKGVRTGIVAVIGTDGYATNQAFNGRGLGVVEIEQYKAACAPGQRAPCRLTAGSPVVDYHFGSVSVGDSSETQVIFAVFVRGPVGSLAVATDFGKPADFAQDTTASVAWPAGAGGTIVGPCPPLQTIATLPHTTIPYCTMLVSFAPQSKSPATKTAVVTVTGGDGTSDHTSVKGDAHGPLTLSPSPFTFGVVAAGSAGAARALTVCNHAPTAASNVQVAVTGLNAADFVVVLDPISNSIINPNGACDQTLSLRLEIPKAETATFLTATLTVSATIGGVTESDMVALVGEAGR
jgi:hypothetical protein